MALTTLTLVPRACYCLPPLRFEGGRGRRTRQVIKAELPSAAMGSGRPESKLMEFPHLTAAHRDLMVDLIQAVDDGVGEHLLPSTVPSDVEYYQNQTGTSQGTLLIRSALPPSPIDFMIASWLHLKQPHGGAFNITNIAGYLKTTNDIPHFQFELVQCSPTFLIFFLDLIPRVDIILRPDYLTTFYEETELEKYRRRLDAVSEVSPYFSSSLFFRKVVSSTGILVSVKCEESESGRVEKIIREEIGPISKEVLRIWMELCSNGGREIEDGNERSLLEKRDLMIKKKAIEMDLSKTMPLQFGEEVAERVLRVIRSAFKTA
ncbi:Red chlorophyll catabolite reductase, chloroplastic, partial [Cucurbita argyrosperma subsp. sororia]